MRPIKTIQITKPKVLIGEGDDEVRFFTALLKHLRIEDVQVLNCVGKDNMSKFLKALNEPMPGFRDVVAIGITRDADGSIEPDGQRTSESARNAFRSVCGALLGAGLPEPANPIEIANGSPSVSVFILPDCKGNGMLEDLCLASIQDDPSFRCTDAFFACASQSSGIRPGNMAKARIHAWLATRRRPDLRLGEAAENGIWPWDHEAFGSIRNFLLAL